MSVLCLFLDDLPDVDWVDDWHKTGARKGIMPVPPAETVDLAPTIGALVVPIQAQENDDDDE